MSVEQREFWLYLPSNSKNSPTTNTPGEFTVRLPRVVKLRGQWEVALGEAVFPYNWCNIPRGEYIAMVTNKENPNEGTYLSTIPEGNYRYPDELLDIIGKKVKIMQNVLSLPSGSIGGDQMGAVVALFNPNQGGDGKMLHQLKSTGTEPTPIDPMIEFNLDVHSVKVRLAVKTNSAITILISPTLSRVLSLPMAIECKQGLQEFEGRGPINLHDSWDPLFMYLDAVEPTLVGHTEVKLLRCIPLDGRYGEVIFKTFDPMHYVRMQLSSFENLTISIRDSAGRPVPFAPSGTVIVKLHFRPARNNPI
jgi:hypothetical protein